MLCVTLETTHTTSKTCAEPNNIEMKPSEKTCFFSVTPSIWKDDISRVVFSATRLIFFVKIRTFLYGVHKATESPGEGGKETRSSAV